MITSGGFLSLSLLPNYNVSKHTDTCRLFLLVQIFPPSLPLSIRSSHCNQSDQIVEKNEASIHAQSFTIDCKNHSEYISKIAMRQRDGEIENGRRGMHGKENTQRDDERGVKDGRERNKWIVVVVVGRK